MNPCEKCGSIVRYKNGKCRPCTIRKACEWQKKNPERANAGSRRWASKNPRVRRNRQVRTYAQRKSANPAGFSASTSLSSSRRRARIAGSIIVNNCLSTKALYSVAAAFRVEGRDVHVDHIIPLARGGVHVFENLRIITAEENRRKGAR